MELLLSCPSLAELRFNDRSFVHYSRMKLVTGFYSLFFEGHVRSREVILSNLRQCHVSFAELN